MRWPGRRHEAPDAHDAEDQEVSPDHGGAEPGTAPVAPEERPLAPSREEPAPPPVTGPQAQDLAQDRVVVDVAAKHPESEPVGAGPTDRPAAPSPSSRIGRGRRSGRPRRPGRGGLSWLLPAVLLLLVVTLWPLGRAVHESLFQSSLVTPDSRTFVGLDGYVSVLGSRTWWLAVATTLGFVAAAVALQLALASAFATALRRVTHGVRWLQALLLVPFGLLAVVTATTWRDGLTTGFGPQWFGYDGESVAAGVAALLASEVWRGTGITTLILLAGLARVSPALREAAIADGANAWQRFWRVTRPAAAPAVAVAVTYRALDALRVLEAPLLASDPTPGTVTLLVWDTTFESFELGLGAVVSVLLLLLAGLVGLLLSKGLRVRRVL